MNGRRGRLFTAGSVLALAFLAEGGGCSQEPSPEPTVKVTRSLDPLTRALADLPIPPPPPNLPSEPRSETVEVTFVLEIFDADLHELHKRVGLRATAWGPGGQIAEATDPKTGKTTPMVDDRIVTTPWKYKAILDPNVVAVGLQVLYLVGHVNDYLSCHATVDGRRVRDPASDSIERVRALPGRSDGLGRATLVRCLYVGP